MALRLLAHGHVRPALENARAEIQGFHRRIQEHYSASWEKMQADPGFANSHGGKGLASELKAIERSLAAAQAAERIYSADWPVSRASLRTMSDLASEVARFVSKSRGDLAECQTVELGKGDTPQALKAAVTAAKESINNIEYSWPNLEAAWASVQSDLDSKGKLPAVAVHERLAPEQAPRQFAPQMITSVLWPQRESLHATGPGSQLFMTQPDALSIVISLHRPEIEAHLRTKLETLYSNAEASGILILSAIERKNALKAARADLLQTERKLAQIFWNEFEQHGRTPDCLNYESDPRAVLGLE